MSEAFDLTENPVSSLYGSNCFSNGVMRERLPKNVYKEILAVQAGEKELTLEVAEVVATSMRAWALEKGATHYTHWFQPLTGLTAEKHDSFIAQPRTARFLWNSPAKNSSRGSRMPPVFLPEDCGRLSRPGATQPGM
jgi:Uncharacterized protein related to glutamine synthetase